MLHDVASDTHNLPQHPLIGRWQCGFDWQIPLHWDESKGTLRLVAQRDYAAGEEIFIRYWPEILPNADTMLLYGFIEANRTACDSPDALTIIVTDAQESMVDGELVPVTPSALCVAENVVAIESETPSSAETSTHVVSPSRPCSISLQSVIVQVCGEMPIQLYSGKLPHVLLLRERLLALRWNEVCC
jgi:hypothetical protein